MPKNVQSYTKIKKTEQNQNSKLAETVEKTLENLPTKHFYKIRIF
jgi:hypothetical protein